MEVDAELAWISGLMVGDGFSGRIRDRTSSVKPVMSRMPIA